MKSVARERAVPPYIVDDAVYRRFDPRHHCFGRSTWDSTASFHGQGIHDRAAERIARASDEGDERYDWIEFCRARASWTVEDYFEGAYARERLGTPVEAIATRGRIEQSPSVMSEVVRETAMQYGADLVGFCRVDRRWLYDMTPATLRDAPRYARDPVPDGLDQAVVMAIAMDATAIHQSPGFAAARATGIGYSRMAFVASCLAQFIRNLGYRALPMGNDTALSIPIAIEAGLGAVVETGAAVKARRIDPFEVQAWEESLFPEREVLLRVDFEKSLRGWKGRVESRRRNRAGESGYALPTAT